MISKYSSETYWMQLTSAVTTENWQPMRFRGAVWNRSFRAHSTLDRCTAIRILLVSTLTQGCPNGSHDDGNRNHVGHVWSIHGNQHSGNCSGECSCLCSWWKKEKEITQNVWKQIRMSVFIVGSSWGEKQMQFIFSPVQNIKNEKIKSVFRSVLILILSSLLKSLFTLPCELSKL